MSRLTLAIAIAVFVICAALAAILYVSLVPYFSLLGRIALVILIVLAVCAIVFALVFTYTHAATMIYNMKQARLNSNVVERAGIVVWIQPNGKYYHLSAEHERAKVPQTALLDTPDEIEAIEAPRENKYPYNISEEELEKGVCGFVDQGASERSIAEFYHISRAKVRKIKTKYGLMET